MVDCPCDTRYSIHSCSSTIVCTNCGKEIYVLNTCNYENCGFVMSHSPFLSGYSRTKRFRQMVESLFHPTPSNPDTKMLTHLFANKDKITSSFDLIDIITGSGLKDKRFVSLHLFCKLFDPLYTPPKHGCLFQMKKRMVFQFQKIESKFKFQYSGVPFINYTYLVRYLLVMLGYEEYLSFVKELKCEKRKAHYDDMLVQLSGENQITTV